jgi:hypothetical protein
MKYHSGFTPVGDAYEFAFASNGAGTIATNTNPIIKNIEAAIASFNAWCGTNGITSNPE